MSRYLWATSSIFSSKSSVLVLVLLFVWLLGWMSSRQRATALVLLIISCRSCFPLAMYRSAIESVAVVISSPGMIKADLASHLIAVSLFLMVDCDSLISSIFVFLSMVLRDRVLYLVGGSAWLEV